LKNGGINVKNKYKIIILTLIILGFTLIVYAAGVIITTGIKARPVKSDGILILGCRVYGTIPSPMLKARLDEGLRLYKEGYGKYIIVSGGQGSGEAITEAEAMKNYLVSRGISPESIILEDKSVSTFENLEYSKGKMKEYNIKAVIIVSNKYHLKRASLMASRANIKASYSGIFLKQHFSNEAYGFGREILALWKYYILGN
jgi:uncharacterized SAM-binding protein YcdF (DUF218 family)